jgi:large subunit ribosomal protein L4
MLKINTYSAKGTKLEAFSLPKELEEKVNLTLLAQAIRVYEEKAHPGLAKAKTRAEVNRTKKKWYRQKGTGSARHGAKSAPIFVGGGAAHGPRPIKRELILPNKMKRKALKMAFSTKAENKEIVAVDGLSKVAKTKDIQSFIAKLGKDFPKAKKLSFVLSEANLKIRKALQNLENVAIYAYKDLNAYNVFYGGILVLDKEIFEKKSQISKLKSQK